MASSMKSKASENYPADEVFHLCRMLRSHALMPITNDDAGWSPLFGYGLAFECARCGARRRDTINVYGGLEARSYVYPDGYQYPRGVRAPAVADLRAGWLQRHGIVSS